MGVEGGKRREGKRRQGRGGGKGRGQGRRGGRGGQINNTERSEEEGRSMTCLPVRQRRLSSACLDFVSWGEPRGDRRGGGDTRKQISLACLDSLGE